MRSGRLSNGRAVGAAALADLPDASEAKVNNRTALAIFRHLIADRSCGPAAEQENRRMCRTRAESAARFAAFRAPVFALRTYRRASSISSAGALRE